MSNDEIEKKIQLKKGSKYKQIESTWVNLLNSQLNLCV
jgi:hypothetical protein